MRFLSPLLITKFVPSAISDSDIETGFFTAYASTFNNTDRHGDVVVPGAFADSIMEMDSGQRNIPLLWQHDRDQPVGVVLSAQEDDRGLLIEGHVLTKSSETAGRAYQLMKKGALSLSIGFDSPDPYKQGGGNVIKNIDLMEISLVSMASNRQSTILSVKSLRDLTRADWQRMLVNGTCPLFGHNMGEIVTKGIMGAIGSADDDQPEPDTAEVAALQSALARLTTTLKS